MPEVRHSCVEEDLDIITPYRINEASAKGNCSYRLQKILGT
jgi:hypothetical protein